MIDLLSLLKNDGFRVVRESTSRGGQFNGPCPFNGCGGHDRFRVQPYHGTYGWFACSQCGRKGNAVDYLMMMRGLSKWEALAAVGWMPKDNRIMDGVPQYARHERPQWEEPPAQWQAAAAAFAERCQRILWEPQGKQALDYLQRRGLTEKTIRAARLGYHPHEAYGPAKQWGRPVKLPQGIVIPWVISGKLWRITVRNERVAAGAGRYQQLTGGSNGLYLAGLLKRMRPAVVLTEGELDALSVVQECGDWVNVVGTGTTEGSHTPRWVSLLARQARVLVAFDAEEKGDRAATWWLARLDNAQRLRPWWKDANQMLQDGADLRQWVMSSSVFDTAPKSAESVYLAPHIEAERETLREAAQPEALPGNADDGIATRCCVCGAEVEYYSDQGQPFCSTHRYGPSQQQCAASPSLARVTQAHFFLADLVEIGEYLSATPGPVALDLETSGLVPQRDRVISIALGTPGKVFVLDMRPYYALSPEWQMQWKDALARLFQQYPGVWIGHNLKFDWEFLALHFEIRPRRVYDTMLAEQLINHASGGKGRVSASLRETAARYGMEVEKEQRNWFVCLDKRPEEWRAPFPAEQLAYIVQDIEIPYRIAEDYQRPRLKQENLLRVMALENDALPALAAMELRGALVDQDTWKQVLSIKRARQAELEPELRATLGAAFAAAREQRNQEVQHAYAAYQQALKAEETRLMQEYTTSDARGKKTFQIFHQEGVQAWKAKHPEPEKPKDPNEPFKLSSTEHLIEALAGLGIKVLSTREEVLEDLALRYPILEKFLSWRKLQHFLSAFGENLLAHIQPDGRIHATFNQVGAVSGRIICTEPNLQQIPKQIEKGREAEDIRRCFIAPPGFLLLKADLSNIELRILAEVSRDKTMLRLFAERKDLHEETAKFMFRLPADTDTREHCYNGQSVRDIAKAINFGLAYGMGPYRLADRIGVSVDEARTLMEAYFSMYRGIAAYLRQAAPQALKQGYAVTLAGRKRGFNTTGMNKAERGRAERSAKNHPIQGTNADILKRALALLYDLLPHQVSIMLTVHDEIVLECPKSLLSEAERILKQAMVQACWDFLKVVHIPEPDVLVAPYWKK